MKNTTANEEVIDLTDSSELSEMDLKERHIELDRVARKIDALKGRQATLRRELGLNKSNSGTASTEDDSVLFLDETLDVFAASSPAQRSEDASADFDIDNVEFDERFAAFASTDEQGDHKARRWFHKA